MRNFLGRIKSFVFSLFVDKRVGARALVIQENRVLLIKHTYVTGWYTIGGAIEAGETPIQAVQRELWEEAGITCLALPKLFSVYHSNHENRDDYIVLYLVEQFEKKPVRSFEILDEQWFDLKNLPEDISPATKRRIEEYIGNRVIDERW
ncbi:NUDIX domain-containing protein [Legionella micdadei]|uniref:ADP-ribose pyrophosphatase YjhB, NUDIX family n=1 Tax=Legionella micdadei TaxID=451 RepID=A0A098GHI4_LEGMI|nr:NUDIX domain-containing protein [Legionella micdadei]ARG97124.1 NUDIX domain-containing protein [Legionella micdadei]ARH00618.1 NUDIX domain-containing protein [Legionella micdadei]KTD29281.1 MutT/nudix family protein [Legionella micdadei]NSL17346.1 NUDIX domain-containing protein [Legionella micdadei]CEG61437.1 NUDIX hydrolase [Legionella micdadei]